MSNLAKSRLVVQSAEQAHVAGNRGIYWDLVVSLTQGLILKEKQVVKMYVYELCRTIKYLIANIFTTLKCHKKQKMQVNALNISEK